MLEDVKELLGDIDYESVIVSIPLAFIFFTMILIALSILFPSSLLLFDRFGKISALALGSFAGRQLYEKIITKKWKKDYDFWFIESTIIFFLGILLLAFFGGLK